VGSNPIPGTFPPSTVLQSREGTYEDYLREEKRNAPSTIHSKERIIRRLKKRVNLWDTKEVEKYLIHSEMTNGHKNSIGFAYQDWCMWNGFEYTPLRFKRNDKLPYVPSESDIDQLIAGNGRKIGCFLQFLKESACRPIEAWRVTPEDVDLNQQVCYINKPAKGSNPRVFKMSDKLTAMVTRLIRETSREERIWKGELKTITRNFQRKRTILSERLGNPNLKRISFKTFRHWKATNEYHRTKDILHVKRMLGHRHIENTLVYTHLIDFEEEDAFTVKVASSIEEFTELLEAGFEYVSDYEGRKVLRKRK
jgi:integrase